MKKHRFLIIILMVLTIGSLSISTETASAKSYWAHNHWVTLKRNVKVSKIKISYPLYKSHSVATYTAKKGSHYLVRHNSYNYGWLLYSGKFHSDSKYAYAVAANESDSSWFKMGIHKSNQYKFRTAASTDFFYDSWEPAYLDYFKDKFDLYNYHSDAKKEENVVSSIDSNTDKFSAKWLSKTQYDDVILIKYHSKTYYGNDKHHAIRPYSAFKDGGVVASFLKPTDKKSILKHGNHIYKGTQWAYYTDSTRDHYTLYKFNGKKWVKGHSYR